MHVNCKKHESVKITKDSNIDDVIGIDWTPSLFSDGRFFSEVIFLVNVRKGMNYTHMYMWVRIYLYVEKW